STLHNLFLETEIQDSQLRMIFACTHPAITEESQIALILKTLCGLTNAEIAEAFLTNEETIGKRIYRAKEKIKAERIDLRVPQGTELRHRLEVVLKTLYVLFSEGYHSASRDRLIREDLCEDSMRLVFLLTQHPATGVAETNALLALMCFQSSRLGARLDDHGNIILLKHQDRSKWYRPLIDQGFIFLEAATAGETVSPYHLEATIASLHAAAQSFETTPWPSIYGLYSALYRLKPEPVIALNKAIASAYATSRRHALEELLAIRELDQYYIYHASVAEIYFELGELPDARHHYQQAFTLTQSPAERDLLLMKIEACSRG
ncbi:MAG TPA: DUF6596 domain-containing protein, partial [Chitinophagaceae bacterium]